MLTIIGPTSSAFASAEPTRSSAELSPTVSVAIDPRVAEITVAALRTTLSGHLPGMTPQVHSRPVSDQRHATWVEQQLAVTQVRAVVWIEPDPEGGLRIGLRLAGDGGTWARRLPPNDDPAVLLEQIGAMLSGMLTFESPNEEQPPPPSPEPTPSAPEPAVVAEPIHPLVVDASVGYLGSMLGASAPWTHGVTVQSGVWLRRGWVLGGAVGVVPPHRLAAGANVRVYRVPIHASFGYRFRRDRRFSPAVIGLAEVDALGWSPARGDGIEGRRGWAARASVGAGVDGRIGLGRGAFLGLRASFRAWLVNGTIVVRAQEDSRTILRGYPISAVVTVHAGYAWSLPTVRRTNN